MDRLFGDFVFSFRTLWKDRASLALALLALALGIGSTTAMFSVIDNILLNPWPYADGNRLSVLNVYDAAASKENVRRNFTPSEFAVLEKNTHVFRDVLSLRQTPVVWTHGTTPALLQDVLVSGNTFQSLAVSPVMGRLPQPSDARPGAPPVFVMSYKTWQSYFAGSRDLLGKTFIFSDRPATLIGIMPSRFIWFGGDIWQPRDPAAWAAGSASAEFVGHLKPGIDSKSAEREVTSVLRQLAKTDARRYSSQIKARVTSFTDEFVGQSRRTLYLLLGAVGFLLLIACANVANLLLAKATAREKELAVRSSLGASKWQIARLLLTESLVLALAGAILGVFLAWGELRLLLAILPEYEFPTEAAIGLNVPVLVAALALAILTSLIFGMAPAAGILASNLSEPLKAGGRGNSGFRRGRLRNALIAAEVAISVILLSAAGLMMHSFLLEQQTDLGIRPERLLTTMFSLTGDRYQTVEQRVRFDEELTARLRALPGVVDASASTYFPPFGGGETDFELPGKAETRPRAGELVYFDGEAGGTLGLRLLRGRFLNPVDIAAKRKVGVVNQTLARSFFPGEDPIGRPIQPTSKGDPAAGHDDPTFEIVGVVADVKNNELEKAAQPELDVPLSFNTDRGQRILMRTTGKPESLEKALAGTILTMDRNVVPANTSTIEDAIESFELAGPRFEMQLLSIFGLVGLLLVSVGVYSVVSYTVSQQTREIGIRVSLGGTRSHIRNWVLRSGMRYILIGMVCGAGSALLLLRLLQSEIAGVSAMDPVTLGLAGATILLVGLLACSVPALRATRIDPAVALRRE